MTGTEISLAPHVGAGSPGDIPQWRIEDLTRGGVEAQIVHEGSLYRLRITSNRKLILTK